MPPLRVRKRPIVVDAFQYDGTNGDEVVAWVRASGGVTRFVEGELWIETLEGQHIATVGDYVIRGVEGEYYPCKPSIFITTYERVDQ